VPVDVSVMTGASYQAVTPNCRVKFAQPFFRRSHNA